MAISLYGSKKLPHILLTILGGLLILVLSSSTLQQRIKLGLDEQASYQTSKELTSIGIRAVYYQNTWE